MKIFDKKIVSTETVLFSIALLLFLGRLYVCSYIQPDFRPIDPMDYYGYIELAKNIFHKLDFTVKWELDSPVQYPPFFSILIYLLNCFTKNFIASIQLINIFSTSFCIIPLFFMVKRILNVYSAILAVVFTNYYFGLGACYGLWSDYFFSSLVIVICWFLVDVLMDKSRVAGRYVFTGVLMSVLYLTKFSGAIFILAGMGAILYYFVRHEKNLKVGLRMSLFLLLGAAPLLLSYHLLLNRSVKENTPNISTYAFFDGSNLYQGGDDYRKIKKGELNPGGTEYSFLSLIKNTNEYEFFLENPGYVYNKYIWGFQRILRLLTLSVLSLMRNVDLNFAFIFQGTFLFLLLVSGLYFKWHFRMMPVLLFAIGLLLIPFLYLFERYLMPYMPFYFILWLFVFNAAYHMAGYVIKNKTILKSLAFVVYISLILCYGFSQCQEIVWSYQYRSKIDERFLKTASWIKDDSRGLPKRVKIMARSNYLSFLTDSDYMYIPADLSWDRIINFAQLKHVDYIVLDGGYVNDVDFSNNEFFWPRDPLSLLKAVVGKREIHFNGVATPLGLLNKLLGYKDLYQFVPILPEGSSAFIDRIKQRSPMRLSELKKFNRLLIEVNYPSETPDWRWTNKFKSRIHKIIAGNEIIYIFKI